MADKNSVHIQTMLINLLVLITLIFRIQYRLIKIDIKLNAEKYYGIGKT